jgi:hypothetical protein
MDELVKESVPFAEKNPLIESAWATAALLIAKAVNTSKRLSMVGLREQFAAQEIPSAAFREMLRCPGSVGQHIQIKKIALCSTIQTLSVTPNGRFIPLWSANFCLFISTAHHQESAQHASPTSSPVVV